MEEEGRERRGLGGGRFCFSLALPLLLLSRALLLAATPVCIQYTLLLQVNYMVTGKILSLTGMKVQEGERESEGGRGGARGQDNTTTRT